MTVTLQIQIISQDSTGQAQAAVRRLREILRAEFPMITVVYPAEAAEEAPPNRDAGRYIERLKRV